MMTTQHRAKRTSQRVGLFLRDGISPESASCEGYELLASGAGQRLERWNGIVIQRPESAAIWPWIHHENLPSWQGFYDGIRATGGQWQWLTPLPSPCIVRHSSLSFLIKPTASKHLGLFPEQAINWHWIQKAISAATARRKPIRVLNLFGYTGGTTLAAAAAGASVTHVDSARAMVGWCSENANLSGLSAAPIRYIIEDAMKYLQREIRRGQRYDAIVMDPPSFGRGKNGELWKLSEHLPMLLDAARSLLSEKPLFLLLNTYSNLINDLSEGSPESLIEERFGSRCERLELSLTGTLDQQRLCCGITYRWQPAC
jgi:23S rRNA (cytosine1962-C5)-methyltransferase